MASRAGNLNRDAVEKAHSERQRRYGVRCAQKKKSEARLRRERDASRA